MLLITACSEKETTASFVLATTGNLTITKGQTGFVNITIARTTDFNDSITFSLSGQPNGVTASFEPVSTKKSSSKLSLAVTNQAVAGKYRLKIIGNSVDVSAEANLELNIQEAEQEGNFSLSFADIRIKKGSSKTNTVIINRTNGFDKDVLLSLNGLADGITAVFNPIAAKDTSELTITVSDEVEAREYFHTIFGQAIGVASKGVNFKLTVEPKDAVDGDFGLRIGNITVKRGSSNKIDVSVVRTNGFADLVNLSFSNNPAGMSAQFNPQLASNKSEMTIGVAENVELGNYMVRISGVANGKTRTVNFIVKVESGEDKQQPHAISISPPHNRGGARNDVNIVITFSEAMNKDNTEAAYSSNSLGIKPNEVSFSWNNDQTVLTINPNHDLAYKTVDDLNSLGYEYSWQLSDGATDLAGNKLINPLSHKFRTLREMTQTIISEKDFNITKDVQIGGCLGQDLNHEVLCIGDTGLVRANSESPISSAAVPDNVPMRGFYSFSIADLPETITEIKRATFYAYQKHGNTNGNAYVDLKKPGQFLIIEHVYFGPIVRIDFFDTAVLHSIGNLSDNARVGYKAADVTTSLRDDYSKPVLERFNKSQYRLRFAKDTDNDGTLDMVEFYTHNVQSSNHRPKLVVKYLLP